MKKQFLRILPVVAAVLLATSCSKDDDNAVDNNVTPGTETVAEKQVYYLKVSNGESLSKIALDGNLGDGQKKSLKFEGGDDLTLEFTVKYGEGENATSKNVTIVGTYDNGKGAFGFNPENATNSDKSDVTDDEKTAIDAALAVMQTEKADVSSYNVSLTYGTDTPDANGYKAYADVETLFKHAKRVAKGNFTLQADGYGYLVYESGAEQNVYIQKIGENNAVSYPTNVKDGENLAFIISDGLKLQKCNVNAETNTVEPVDANAAAKTVETGKLIYVKNTSSK